MPTHIMKTLLKLKGDPRVKDAWSEQDSGDGYWVDLKVGFADMAFDPWQPSHTIHEPTIKRLLGRMRGVRPCNCKDCLS